MDQRSERSRVTKVLDAKTAKELFLIALKNKELIKENIIYKNGKYYKETNLLCGDGL